MILHSHRPCMHACALPCLVPAARNALPCFVPARHRHAFVHKLHYVCACVVACVGNAHTPVSLELPSRTVCTAGKATVANHGTPVNQKDPTLWYRLQRRKIRKKCGNEAAPLECKKQCDCTPEEWQEHIRTR
eukprot:scaffold47990_cov20-Tisochrysis_lutea.AAC.1